MTKLSEKQLRYLPQNLELVSVDNPLYLASNKVTAGLYNNVVGVLDKNERKRMKQLMSEKCKIKEDMRQLQIEKRDMAKNSDHSVSSILTKSSKDMFIFPKSSKKSKGKSDHIYSSTIKECYFTHNQGVSGDQTGYLVLNTDSVDDSSLLNNKEQTYYSDNVKRKDADLVDEIRKCKIKIPNDLDIHRLRVTKVKLRRSGDTTRREKVRSASYPSGINVQKEISHAVQRIVAAKDRIVIRKLNNEPYITQLRKLTTSCHSGSLSTGSEKSGSIKFYPPMSSPKQRIISSFNSRSKMLKTDNHLYPDRTRTDNKLAWTRYSNRVYKQYSHSVQMHTRVRSELDRAIDKISEINKLPVLKAHSKTDFSGRKSAPPVFEDQNSVLTNTKSEESGIQRSCSEETLLRLYNKASLTGNSENSDRVLMYFLNGWTTTSERTRMLAQFLQTSECSVNLEKAKETLKLCILKENCKIQRLEQSNDVSPREIKSEENDYYEYFKNTIFRLLKALPDKLADIDLIALVITRFPEFDTQDDINALISLCASTGFEPIDSVNQIIEANEEPLKTMQSDETNVSSNEDTLSAIKYIPVPALAASPKVSFDSLPANSKKIKRSRKCKNFNNSFGVSQPHASARTKPFPKAWLTTHTPMDIAYCCV